jgi:single-strand DNA-binding protein
VNFSIANNRVFIQNGSKKEEVSYFECTAWGKLADIIKQYTGKGKQVLVQGRLKQDTWDTPDGKKASKIKIIVENLQLLGGRSEGGGIDSSHSSFEPNYYGSQEPVYDPGIQEMDPEDIF